MTAASTNGLLRVAVPNKGALSESAAHILSEAGYRRRTDPKDLTVVDPVNKVEFFFLRPKDIAIYVGSGQLDFGITGRDLAAESMAPVSERLALGFGSSTFRYAAPAGRDWKVADLQGKSPDQQFKLIADRLGLLHLNRKVLLGDRVEQVEMNPVVDLPGFDELFHFTRA